MSNERNIERGDQLPSLSAMGLLVCDHISAMLAYWDSQQICRFANNAYVEWFGRTSEEMIDRITMKELLGPLYEKNLPYILRALKGERQVFEREIPLPGGHGSRHSLATYTPDIANGIVRGFFVHVADVTPLKLLEQQLDASRRQMLKAVIDAQESERATVAHILREDVCQTLAYCQISMQSPGAIDQRLFESVRQTLKDSLNKLNVLSSSLSPAAVKDLFLHEALQMLTSNFATQHSIPIRLTTDMEDEVTMRLNNKLAVFRIVESFLEMMQHTDQVKQVTVNIFYRKKELEMAMICYRGEKIDFSNLKPFENIRIRTAYYNGSMEQFSADNEHTLLVRFLSE